MEKYKIVVTCNDGISDASLRELLNAIMCWRGVNNVELKKTITELPPGTCPYCKGTRKGTWSMGGKPITTKCLYCRGSGKSTDGDA